MVYNVIFTDEADDTFDSIGKQIEQRWNQKELFKFRTRVYSILELISRSPFIFQEVAKDSYLRKAAVHKNCTMYYEVKDVYILVHFFSDNRQNPIL
jgi:hypothetical protein